MHCKLNFMHNGFVIARNILNLTLNFDLLLLQPDSPWPTNLNLTEEEARQMCGNYLVQSKAGVNCQNLFSGNYSQDIDNCVQDYKVRFQGL